MEKSNFLQKIPLESGLTTHFGYMGVHIEKPHGHFFCTSYYPKYRHLDQCASLWKPKPSKLNLQSTRMQHLTANEVVETATSCFYF